MSDPTVSFEFFPPGDEAMAQQLWQSVQRLAPLRPSFVSVTYGADGSTRTRTHEFVQSVLKETSLTGRAALDLRGRLARGSAGHCGRSTGSLACGTWWRCAAMRPPPSRSRWPLSASFSRVRLCLGFGAGFAPGSGL